MNTFQQKSFSKLFEVGKKDDFHCSHQCRNSKFWRWLQVAYDCGSFQSIYKDCFGNFFDLCEDE